jgi:peptide/nickel transport system substrate-binding protein
MPDDSVSLGFLRTPLSRRTALQASLLGLGGLAASTLVGCSSDTSPATTSGGGQNGTLRVALGTFDEGTYLPNTGSGTRQTYISPILEYPYLAGFRKPGLAQGLLTTLNLSSDGLTISGKVRPGVKFHDGTTLTSVDIGNTVDLMISPNSLVALAPTLRTIIKSIDTSDPSTITFHLSAPYAGFPGQLSSYGLFAGVMPKAYVDQVGQTAADKHPIGTGPFKFVSQSLDTIELESLTSHWRVVPQFKRLSLLNVPEASSAVDLLQTGGVDIINPDVQSAASILKSDQFKVFSYPGAYVLMLLFGNDYIPADKRYTGQQPYSDIRVREAMNIAIDRDAIVKSVYQGYATPARIGYADPTLPASYKPYPYDPRKATQLLAAAGYPNGFELTVNSWPFSPGAELPDVIQIVTQYWQQVGIRTKIVPGQYASFRPKWFAGQAAGQIFGISGAGYETGWQSWAERFYGTNSPIAIYESTAFNNFITQWGNEVSPAAQSASAKQFAIDCYNNYTEIGIAVADGLYIANKNTVSNYAPPAQWYEQYYEYTQRNPVANTATNYTPEPNPQWEAISGV